MPQTKNAMQADSGLLIMCSNSACAASAEVFSVFFSIDVCSMHFDSGIARVLCVQRGTAISIYSISAFFIMFGCYVYVMVKPASVCSESAGASHYRDSQYTPYYCKHCYFYCSTLGASTCVWKAFVRGTEIQRRCTVGLKHVKIPGTTARRQSAASRFLKNAVLCRGYIPVEKAAAVPKQKLGHHRVGHAVVVVI